MTPSRSFRPVLVCLSVAGLGLSTASCGADPHRFESLARSVADIPLDEVATGQAQASKDALPATLVMSAAAQGLRSALGPSHKGLKVEVMDPHALWDARDADLRGRVGPFAPAGIEAAAPAVAKVATDAVSDRMDRPQGLRPAIARTEAAAAKPRLRPAVEQGRTTIQLGAYSSPQAARSAWATVSAGSARAALNGLAPVFERVMVDGRPFTRLKIQAPTSAAAALCRAAQVSDPWCEQAR